jgi:hypothetical protein
MFLPRLFTDCYRYNLLNHTFCSIAPQHPISRREPFCYFEGRFKKDDQNKLKDIGELKNKKAHSQDVITGNWPDIVKLIEWGKVFLKRCEKL